MDAAEALRRAGRGAVLSHESAARELGLELVEPGEETLSVPRNRSRVTLPGWRIHRADVTADDRQVVGELVVTAPLRTIVDLCRRLPTPDGVAVADSGVRLGLVEHSELHGRLAGVSGRGARRVRSVAAWLDPQAGSVLESLLRVALMGAGLAPVSQYVVLDGLGRFVARVDFCWPKARLIVEADGFAFHADRAAYRRDRDRLNQLERLGWRVLRFTWEDVRHRPEHVIALVRECLDRVAA